VPQNKGEIFTCCTFKCNVWIVVNNFCTSIHDVSSLNIA
jgi:hypothetical protein